MDRSIADWSGELFQNLILARAFVSFLGLLGVLLWPLPAAAAYGLDAPTPVAPFLNGVFPTTTPNAPGSSSWSVVPAFPNITSDNALVIVPNPANSRLYVGSRGGEIRSFENQQSVATSALFLDLRDRVEAVWDGGFLGMIFHPEFGVPTSPYRNYFYVYYSSNCPIDAMDSSKTDMGACQPIATGSTSGFFGAYLRLARYEVVDGSPLNNPVADPESEQVMLNIRLYNGSHRGGGLVFGNDGYLYLTIGDQFRYVTAQDVVQTLEGGSFRLDVNIVENSDGTWSCQGNNYKPVHVYPVPDLVGTGKAPAMGEHFNDEVSGQRYCIPADNPWAGEAGVFEEYNSLGHRNPHRLAIDPITGRLWSGEVGENTREEINIIESGHNYGWPYREGLLPFLSQPNDFVFRGVLTDPVIDFTRAEANAIIGGYVYRGATYPQLNGRYLAGDYVTGKIWAITLDEASQIATKEEIASFSQIGNLGTWGQDNDGEVYLGNVAAQNDTLYQLALLSNPVADPPTWLSETGAFDNLLDAQPAAFFVPYGLNEPFWSDAALKSRWIAVPNDGIRDSAAEQIGFSTHSKWVYPIGTVLMKHFELALDENDVSNTARLETRFLVHGEDDRWYGVTYRWLEDKSDAKLLTAAETQDYQIVTADGGVRTQTWLYPGREMCMGCHNPGVGGAAGPNTHQLNGDFYYPATGRSDNQLRNWNHLGMFSPAFDEAAIATFPKSASKHDLSASLQTRARSYLDSNCSYCHRPGTGNRAFFDMRFTTPLTAQRLINGAVIDSMGVDGAHVITPGDPSRSIAYLRANKTGTQAMPPLAKTLVDVAGMQVLAAWIENIDMSVLANRALGRPAFASSVEAPDLEPALAVDSDGTTRWASAAGSDPQWIYVDLGADYMIDHVVLNWEVAYAKAYEVQVSMDASDWTTVYTEGNSDGGIDSVIFPASRGRYLRIYGTQRGTPWGYSLWELEVYGAVYVEPPVLTSLSVSPAEITLAEGTSKSFVANGLDQRDESMPVSVDWSVSGGGTISADGVFTASEAGGPYTVTAVATVNTAIKATAQVTVIDITPDAFAFDDVADAALSSVYTDSVTVSGITAATEIAVSNGEYSISGGTYTSATGMVNNGDVVSIRLTSASDFGVPVHAVLTIGGLSDTFTVTTSAEDSEPDPFAFAAVMDALPDTPTESNTIVVTGINSTAAISISGGEYAINDGAFTSTAGVVSNLDAIRIRTLSASVHGASVIAAVTIGGITAEFTVTTVVAGENEAGNPGGGSEPPDNTGSSDAPADDAPVVKKKSDKDKGVASFDMLLLVMCWFWGGFVCWRRWTDAS